MANASQKASSATAVERPQGSISAAAAEAPSRYIQQSAVLQISSSSSSSSLVGAEGDEAASKEAEAEETDFGVSLAIGGLLIIPVSTIAIITLLIRLRKSGTSIFLFHVSL